MGIFTRHLQSRITSRPCVLMAVACKCLESHRAE